MIVVETNDYTKTPLEDSNRKALKCDSEWLPVTIDEIKTYFALYVLMGQIKKPSIRLYWSTRKILETKIYSITMSYKRFVNISRFLHFSDDNMTERDDKLRKLRPVIEYIRSKFLSVFNPGKEVVIDESLVKLRARLGYIQFNPSKRARFGIQIYKICDSKTGYCMDFIKYTLGKITVQITIKKRLQVKP